MYPNEPCDPCNEEENDLPTPEPCGDTCEKIVQSDCVNYSGELFLCETTPLLQPGQNLTSILQGLATAICDGVSGLAATIAVGETTLNILPPEGTPSVTINNTGTVNDAIFDFVFNIPGCEPCPPVKTDPTSDDEVTIDDNGAIGIGFVNPIDGSYNWGFGSRLRISADANNYMEGVVTAHSANGVTIDRDYAVGSGTYSSWTVTLAGDPGDRGPAGSVTANTPGTVNDVAYGDPATVSIVNSGTPEAAVLDFTFEIPLANSVAGATVNGSGELELTLDDATVLNAGNVVGPGVAPGGAAGEILKKVDGTDYNTFWGSEDATAHVIAGGNTGYVLGKNSVNDYDLTWIAPRLAPEMPVTPAGSPVPQVYVSSEAELIAALDQFNAVDGGAIGYLGAIIHLAADIVLTQDIVSEFDGIEIHGNNVYSIDHDSAGINRKFECISGSPVFKNVVFKTSTGLAAAGGGTHTRILDLNNSGVNPSVVTFDGCTFKNVVMSTSATGSNILLNDAVLDSELIFKRCAILTDLAIDAGTPTIDIKLVIESAATYEGSVTIEDMKFLRQTSKGQGTARAVGPILPGEEVSSIYFTFIGTWGTAPQNILNIDMESYALSVLNSHFGVDDADRVYIKNSVFMYNDNDPSKTTLKPNGFGVFGYDNPSYPYPVDQTTYV